MVKFKETYEHYQKYPVADAGYGSYNNYLYCEEHGMEMYMKFTMFEKEINDEKYRNNPYRAVNFRRDEQGITPDFLWLFFKGSFFTAPPTRFLRNYLIPF